MSISSLYARSSLGFTTDLWPLKGYCELQTCLFYEVVLIYLLGYFNSKWSSLYDGHDAWVYINAWWILYNSTVPVIAEKLTSWGFKACSSRRNNGAFGAMFPDCMFFILHLFCTVHTLMAVILRNLPRNYAYNNIYGLFPLTVPASTKSLLLKFHSPLQLYDFERPTQRCPHILNTCEDISSVLNRPDVFATTYGSDLELLTKGYGQVRIVHSEHQLTYLLQIYVGIRWWKTVSRRSWCLKYTLILWVQAWRRTIYGAVIWSFARNNSYLHYQFLCALMPDAQSFRKYARYLSDTAAELITLKTKQQYISTYLFAILTFIYILTSLAMQTNIRRPLT